MMASERELDEAWRADLDRREEAGRLHRAEMADRSIAASLDRCRWCGHSRSAHPVPRVCAVFSGRS